MSIGNHRPPAPKRHRRGGMRLAVAVPVALVLALVPTPSWSSDSVVPAFPVVADISIGLGAENMALSPDGKLAYLSGEARTVRVVDLDAGEVTKRITLDPGSASFVDVATTTWFDGVIISGDNEGPYAKVEFRKAGSLELADSVLVDPPVGVPFALVPGTKVPVVAHPTEKLLYVFRPMVPFIQIYDVDQQRVVGQIDANLSWTVMGAIDPKISADGSVLAWKSESGLAVADTLTGQVSIGTGLGIGGEYRFSGGYALSADGRRVFVVNVSGTSRVGSRVREYSLPGFELVGEYEYGGVETGGLPGMGSGNTVAVTPDGRYVALLAVEQRGEPGISVVDLQDPKKQIRSVVPRGSFELVVNRVDGTLWMNNRNTGSLLEFDTRPSRPGKLKVDAKGVPGGATVSWKAKGKGSSLAGVRVTATAKPGGQSCSSEGTSCTIGGLDRGKRYVIRVTSENIVGSGPSARTRVRVPDVKPPKRPPQTEKPGQQLS